ncbi:MULTISPECIES: CidA/LrgA family protein [Cetobacterium]|jgi:holin-like protein|uniref:CidA/LrgA family protein n=1 Tax=Candidatus Cetobacterium colombiensis TaxID=3073100 RepID=A0ABU4WAS2_9FUSO|nr:CidA/LrgA family protein [Candidatus Cetobacterium colombiensis]MDX8336642.1 CidA/LrgA family protein [Candidatus Cetobacterium colombiensis]
MFLEILIIFGITYSGVLISQLFSLPIPGTIMGMFILLTLLIIKVLKVENIEKTSNFILGNMLFLFLPPAVKLLNYIDVLKGGFFRIIFLIVLTTAITMGTTGFVVNFIIERGEKKNGSTK